MKPPLEIKQGKVFMFKCCCEGRKTRYGAGIDPKDGKNKQGNINQDEVFVGPEYRHPFLIITPQERIGKSKYITVIPITSRGDTFHNEAHSLPITGDMVNTDTSKLSKNSFLKIDMPTRVFLENIDSSKEDCEQATFYLGKPLNEILIKVAEKHFSP